MPIKNSNPDNFFSSASLDNACVLNPASTFINLSWQMYDFIPPVYITGVLTHFEENKTLEPLPITTGVSS